MGKQAKKIELKSPDKYCLLAIYTTNNDYRLAWLLNVALNTQLTRETMPDNEDFSFYSDRDSLSSSNFMLIVNNTECKRLFPHYTQIDFFLKVSNMSILQVQEIIKQIKAMDKIIACSLIDNDTKLLKMFNRL